MIVPVFVPVIAPKQKCPNCGQKITAKRSVCTRCGTSLPTTSRGEVAIVLGVLVAVLVGLLTFFIIRF